MTIKEATIYGVVLAIGYVLFWGSDGLVWKGLALYGQWMYG